MLTKEDQIRYQEEGYLIKRSFYGKEEIDRLFTTARADEILKNNTEIINQH